MNREEFDNFTYQRTDPKPDKERQEKSNTRFFWFICVPFGAMAGFLACVVGQSGGFFLPVGGVSATALWAAFGGASD